MNENEYFNKIMNDSGPILYEPEYSHVVISCFTFRYRFHSLQRFWTLVGDYISFHVAILNKIHDKVNSDIEFELMFSETLSSDIEYMPEQLRGTTITMALGIFESFLEDISKEIRNDCTVKLDYGLKSAPFIDKYLLWFSQGCGLNIGLNENIRKELAIIRKVRNKFIHKLNHDLPDDLIHEINQVLNIDFDGKTSINDDFVNNAIFSISELVKKIELAYIDFYKRNQKN